VRILTRSDNVINYTCNSVPVFELLDQILT